MRKNSTKKTIQRFLTVFREMLSTGRKVAVEDACKQVETPDGFDSRIFGVYVAKMKRDGEIVEAGFRTSVTSKHHCGIKRLWVLASIQEKGGNRHEQ
ncbi:hypothetical protein [Rhodopirellula sallentina]|uniref:Uncharacterized protein n=1 Tax=Rhodopirellula sallentina SM41 TaxID=1263870 RepID=M5U309_9BACT|nr:hypothetical protein [Rhodopirellula sallentina]EMI55835.1 hypothetical protein RSSM_02728 [Rhodopirellula sallentina SM41]